MLYQVLRADGSIGYATAVSQESDSGRQAGPCLWLLLKGMVFT